MFLFLLWLFIVLWTDSHKGEGIAMWSPDSGDNVGEIGCAIGLWGPLIRSMDTGRHLGNVLPPLLNPQLSLWEMLSARQILQRRLLESIWSRVCVGFIEQLRLDRFWTSSLFSFSNELIIVWIMRMVPKHQQQTRLPIRYMSHEQPDATQSIIMSAGQRRRLALMAICSREKWAEKQRPPATTSMWWQPLFQYLLNIFGPFNVHILRVIQMVFSS